MPHRADQIITTMDMIREDCEVDALSLDTTSFTPQGVGQRLGEIYAVLLTLAGAVKILASIEVDRA